MKNVNVWRRENLKGYFIKNILTPWQPMRCSLGSVLQFSRCFFYVFKNNHVFLGLLVSSWDRPVSFCFCLPRCLKVLGTTAPQHLLHHPAVLLDRLQVAVARVLAGRVVRVQDDQSHVEDVVIVLTAVREDRWRWCSLHLHWWTAGLVDCSPKEVFVSGWKLLGDCSPANRRKSSIGQNLWAKIYKFSDQCPCIIFPKKYFCNWLIWLLTFVKGSKKNSKILQI